MTEKRRIDEMIRREFAIFKKQAGKLPSKEDLGKNKNIGAVWVLSGGGSYLLPIVNSTSDRIYAKKNWYPGQDKARLDYAKACIDALASLSPLPVLIYNGTKRQNADLRKAIDRGLFKLPKSRLYIVPGEITRTLDQVTKFSFPPSFNVKKMKLAVLSHSAHLPRILRFMRKYPKPFKNVEIVPLSINIQSKIGQRQMEKVELDNLLGYIDRKEAAAESYPFEKNDNKQEPVEVSPVGKSDLMDIFELSNQHSVRAASFNQNKIKLESHKKWFAKKLKDKNVIFLKATIRGELAGQVRLEIENGEAVIGISASEKFRGRSVATELLLSAIDAAKKRGLRAIIALIKPINSGSIGLFEKNGWVFVGQAEESGTSVNKYIYKLKKK